MTATDDLISIHGENFTVNRVSDGAVDSYGDPAPTWASAGTEKVWIQDNPVFRKLQIDESMIGRLDKYEYVAYFLSSSVAAEGDVIVSVASSVRYDVRRIWTQKLFDTAEFKVALIRKSEDT